uniref:Uncharacterized protein n=1 Tax=Rhizophora mucronata TaxID=61149 RepID=A0A2P2NIW4_RHIMU
MDKDRKKLRTCQKNKQLY